MIKAIFFDMDGTLVAYDDEGNGGIPAAAQEILAELRAKGVKIFAATGRGRTEMDESPLFRGVHFDAILSMNGQYCYDDEEDLRVAAIPAEDLAGFLKCLREDPFPAIFMEKRRIFGNMDTPEFASALAKISAVPPPAEAVDDLAEREILQIVPYVTGSTLSRLEAAMPGCKATRWSPEFVDIVEKRGGKDKGIEVILKRFNLTAAEIMAFGDGENDIDMVRMAKIGIAMGNGAEKLKDIADEITEDATADGVANALRRHLAAGSFDE